MSAPYGRWAQKWPKRPFRDGPINFRSPRNAEHHSAVFAQSVGTIFPSCINLASVNPGKIIALDVGDARIGVALSDPLRISGAPWGAFLRNSADYLSKLTDLIAAEEVTLVLIGVPYEADGTVGKQARKILTFQRQLENALKARPETAHIRFRAWDESYTTEEARSHLKGNINAEHRRSGVVDAAAALVLLQDYLTANEHHNI